MDRSLLALRIDCGANTREERQQTGVINCRPGWFSGHILHIYCMHRYHGRGGWSGGSGKVGMSGTLALPFGKHKNCAEHSYK
jgi:hypothetical protein